MKQTLFCLVMLVLLLLDCAQFIAGDYCTWSLTFQNNQNLGNIIDTRSCYTNGYSQ